MVYIVMMVLIFKMMVLLMIVLLAKDIYGGGSIENFDNDQLYDGNRCDAGESKDQQLEHRGHLRLAEDGEAEKGFPEQPLARVTSGDNGDGDDINADDDDGADDNGDQHTAKL